MRNRALIISLAIAGFGLTACNKDARQSPADLVTGAPAASLPLADGAPPPAIAAPAVSSLPAQPPVRYAAAPQQQRYRYIDRAYSLGEAFADSPPDYAVDYQGVRPWVWRSNEGQYRVIEPTPDGDRTYFFDAGSDQPFLIRDPQYAYGYDQGGLVVIYDSDGRLARYDAYAADRAARYLARARALYNAAVHQQRQAAYAEAWRERRAQVIAQQQAWQADQSREAGWRDWRDQDQRKDTAAWDRERTMRVAYAARATPAIGAAPRQSSMGPPPPAPPGGYPWQHPAQAQAQAEQRVADARKTLSDAARRAQAGEPPQQAEAGADRAARQAQVDASQQDRQRADAARQARQVQLAQQQAAGRQAKADRDAHQAQLAQQAAAARNAQQVQAKTERQAQSDGARKARQQADAAHTAEHAKAEAARQNRSQQEDAAHAARQSQAADTAAAKQQAQADRDAHHAQGEPQHQARAQQAQHAQAAHPDGAKGAGDAAGHKPRKKDKPHAD